MLSTITKENLFAIGTKCNMSQVQAWASLKEEERAQPTL